MLKIIKAKMSFNYRYVSFDQVKIFNNILKIFPNKLDLILYNLSICIIVIHVFISKSNTT